MRVLIVENEPLARAALAKVLATRNDVEHFDSANNAAEALEKIGNASFDVLLLDLNLPELSSMELVDRLRQRNQSMPSVVFMTAHQQEVVPALERRPIDPVLDPFSEGRVQEVLDRVFRKNETELAARLMSVFPQLEAFFKRSHKIAIKANGRILFLDPAAVVVVKAEGNYVLLQQESGSHLTRESLSTLAEKLKPYGFIRIHRSILVNTSFVEEIHPCVTGEYSLCLRGGTKYTVSRTYRKNLSSIADSWIGTDAFAVG
jgi:two-component system LytT family response regulator